MIHLADVKEYIIKNTRVSIGLEHVDKIVLDYTFSEPKQNLNITYRAFISESITSELILSLNIQFMLRNAVTQKTRLSNAFFDMN